MAIIYVYSLCKDIVYIAGMRFVVHRWIANRHLIDPATDWTVTGGYENLGRWLSGYITCERWPSGSTPTIPSCIHRGLPRPATRLCRPVSPPRNVHYRRNGVRVRT